MGETMQPSSTSGTAGTTHLAVLSPHGQGQGDAPPALKPPVDPSTLAHKQLLGGTFWQRIPAYADVDEATFLDHKWQAKHSITNVHKLLAAVKGLVSAEFVADALEQLAAVGLLVD